jgi:hypothetical protein
MKTKILLLLLGMHISLLAQSSISVGTGSLITIGTGADISAGSRTGLITGSGTFNGLLLSEPYVATGKPTNVLAATATINAVVNPQGNETTYFFSYGTDPNNLSTNTSTQNAGSGNTNVEVSENLSGLTGSTIYYYKVTATNINGTSVSDQRLFFTDTSIPRTSLVLWLRADNGITSSSGSVSEWSDLSGSNNHASQTSSSNQPAIISEAINTQPAVRFNGSSNYLILPYTQTIGIKDNPYEAFVVAKTSNSNVQFLFSSDTFEKYELHLNGAAGARFIPVASTYIDEGTNGVYSDGNPHVFSSRASSTGGTVRVDGIDGGTTTNNIISSDAIPFKIGYRGADATYYFNGDIAEVILYNSTLSSSDRNTVEQYLAGRYGITSGALPVELTSFTANYVDGKVLLNWQTATEVNNYGFQVERKKAKVESEPWEKIGFVHGNGNSNSPKNYSFIDNLVLANNLALDPNNAALQYRLKQMDFDGRFEYSNIVEVNVEAPKQFALEQNYPNPFNPTTTIKFSIPTVETLHPANAGQVAASLQIIAQKKSTVETGHPANTGQAAAPVQLKIYDILGREVATLVNEQKAPGNYEVKFDASRLASGIYFYKLSAGSFSLTKKMNIIK